MKKKVLIVFYSQTGQLEQVVKSIAAPLEQDDSIELTYECVRPIKPYHFPWRFFDFLEAFPESVYLDPPPIQAPQAMQDHYDLVIIAYQVWFLSPSQPITAFLQSAAGKRLISGRPVVTVIACRNMWLTAQEKMKALLKEAGARLLDNVALVDSSNSLLTFITTPRWLLTGNKGSDQGLLPPAGLAEAEIVAAQRFGKGLLEGLRDGREQGNQPLLAGLAAACVDERLIASERIGHRSFLVWGRLLRALGKPGTALRRPVIAIYAVFLVLMIITVVPISLLVRKLLYPLVKSRLAKQKAYYEQPSGSASFRMRDQS